MKKAFILLIVTILSLSLFIVPVYAELIDNQTLALRDEDEEYDEDFDEEDDEDEDFDEEDDEDEDFDEEDDEDEDFDEEDDEDEDFDEEDDEEETDSSDNCNSISEDTVTTLYMNDYASVPYCKDNDNISSRGCYVVTLTSILKSYGSDVEISDIANYLCTNFSTDINKHPVSYSNVSYNKEFQNHFNFEMNKINGTIADINSTLDKNSMVMLSVTAESGCASSAGHYIALAMRNNDSYYMINTSDRPGCESGWYEKSRIEHFLNNISQGPYEVFATSCNRVASSPNGTNKYKKGRTGNIDFDFHEFGEGGISCQSLETFFKALDGIYTLIKVATPVLVIALSTMEYIKAIANSNAEELKKTNQRTIKRIVIGIIIFFLPDLLDILFKVFGLYNLNGCNVGK